MRFPRCVKNHAPRKPRGTSGDGGDSRRSVLTGLLAVRRGRIGRGRSCTQCDLNHRTTMLHGRHAGDVRRAAMNPLCLNRCLLIKRIATGIRQRNSFSGAKGSGSQPAMAGIGRESALGHGKRYERNAERRDPAPPIGRIRRFQTHFPTTGATDSTRQPIYSPPTADKQ